MKMAVGENSMSKAVLVLAMTGLILVAFTEFQTQTRVRQPPLLMSRVTQ